MKNKKMTAGGYAPGIRKAVFPVAGLGTRFLPATKANPKEMMPVVDKPLIQYAVEEALLAGITDLIFITSSSKRAIEDHFDSHFELEVKLETAKKNELLRIVKNILPRGASCIYVRQTETLGLGHAILCAKNVVGNEPFAVLLADDLIDNDTHHSQGHCLGDMVQRFKTVKSSIIGVEKINVEDSEKYGVVGFKDKFLTFGPIDNIIEKPKPTDALSPFGVVGRYILTPGIFNILETVKPGKNQEIQLTDAISKLLKSEPVYAYEFLGTRYDCGDKLGYLKAIVAYGLKHPEVGEAFQEHIKHLTKI